MSNVTTYNLKFHYTFTGFVDCIAMVKSTIQQTMLNGNTAYHHPAMRFCMY